MVTIYIYTPSTNEIKIFAYLLCLILNFLMISMVLVLFDSWQLYVSTIWWSSQNNDYVMSIMIWSWMYVFLYFDFVSEDGEKEKEKLLVDDSIRFHIIEIIIFKNWKILLIFKNVHREKTWDAKQLLPDKAFSPNKAYILK